MTGIPRSPPLPPSAFSRPQKRSEHGLRTCVDHLPLPNMPTPWDRSRAMFSKVRQPFRDRPRLKRPCRRAWADSRPARTGRGGLPARPQPEDRPSTLRGLSRCHRGARDRTSAPGSWRPRLWTMSSGRILSCSHPNSTRNRSAIRSRSASSCRPEGGRSGVSQKMCHLTDTI